MINRFTRIAVLSAMFFTSGVVLMAQAPAPVASVSAPDPQTQSDLDKLLHGKQYRDVKATPAADGVVTLTGSVSTLYDKLEAAKRARKAANVKSVNNLIEVAGTEVNDQQLAQTLAHKLAYDRVGYGTTTFNAITVQVKNGDVRLGGVVVQPADKDSAEALVTTFPGVKGMVDEIQVAPLSPNDDRIRRAVAQAIYGYPTFTKYGMDPVKPIRIIVVNGNVTLVGSVNSQGDKELAYMRANGVSGVFKVTNDLQAPGTAER
jgi:osmotically-inducible protein OsmY